MALEKKLGISNSSQSGMTSMQIIQFSNCCTDFQLSSACTRYIKPVEQTKPINKTLKYYYPTLDWMPNYSANDDVEMQAVYTNNALSFQNHVQTTLQHALPVSLLCTTTVQHISHEQFKWQLPTFLLTNHGPSSLYAYLHLRNTLTKFYLRTYLHTKALHSLIR